MLQAGLRLRHVLLAAAMAVSIATGVRVDAQDGRDVLQHASTAMGAERLRTLRYSGEGFWFAFGQSGAPGAPWPRFAAKNYVREIDFAAPASKVQYVRSSIDKRGGGGVGLPIVDQPQAQVIGPGAPWAQQVDIWLTPYGFVQHAAGLQPKIQRRTIGGKAITVVTFMEGKYTVNGYIDDQHLVQKIETWFEHPALGDMPIDITFDAYRDFGGLKFPTRIVETQGGHPILDLTVTTAEANVPVDIQPQGRGGGNGGFAVPGGGLAGLAVKSIKADEGVYFIIGGTNNSVAVEFRDYILMIEAPQTEERAVAFIAEARKQIPNKPVRYIVNTHHHFDHSGGLRGFAAEGAVIVTHAMNRAWYERALTGPRTLAPDLLAMSGKPLRYETLTDKKVISDGTRSVEVHLVRGTTHSDGSVMAYLPKERILVEGDLFDSPGPGVPALTEGPPTAANLLDNVERLKLDVDRLLPVHAANVVPVEDLYQRVGRTRPTR